MIHPSLPRRTLLSLAITLALLPTTTHAADAVDLGELVVTAPVMADDPLTVESDPKLPRQPIPAADGAALLDNIPGFSVVRKGGTSGDPMFRGLGGSRLNILQDGAYLFGGCGMRMDPPTAYIYPGTFERLTVIKGPQTVLYGPGNIAATVMFERDTTRFSEPGARFYGGALVGSYGRNDQFIDATAGASAGFLRLIGTRSEADDYQDGDGREVHSEYERWSGTAIAAWTPSDDTRLTLTAERSDAEAAYADRSMDGTKFEREGWSARFEQFDLSPLVGRLELTWYSNYVDHVMDNYSLRQTSGMKMVSNPDRQTDGARIAADLHFSPSLLATVGADWRSDEHTKRAASAMMGNPVLGPRLDDMSAETRGLFTELNYTLNPAHKLVAGARVDRQEATADSDVGGVTAGTDDDQTTTAGFLRWEHRPQGTPMMVYVGLGHTERTPDYWERNRVFDLDRERLTQLDFGLGYKGGSFDANLAAFYGVIDDYILITNTAAKARNVDALLYGFEADATWRFAPHWRSVATIAWTWAENDTDNRPLAQVAPLEATLGLQYEQERWSAGVLARGVMEQDRVDVGSGTIAGTDLGATPGFAVLSLNGGWRVTDAVTLTAGVDNLLDRTYYEHVSRAGAEVAGFEQTDRVYEPGRTFWLKATAKF